jgi:hypothetical protein
MKFHPIFSPRKDYPRKELPIFEEKTPKIETLQIPTRCYISGANPANKSRVGKKLLPEV